MDFTDYHQLAEAFCIDAEQLFMSLADSLGVVHMPTPARSDEPLVLDLGITPNIDEPDYAVSRIELRARDGRWLVCQMRAVTRILWGSLLIIGADLSTYPRHGGYHPYDLAEVWEWSDLAATDPTLWAWFVELLAELVAAYIEWHPQGITPKAGAYLQWFESRRGIDIPTTAALYPSDALYPASMPRPLWRLTVETRRALQSGWSPAQVLYAVNDHGPSPGPFQAALYEARRSADYADILHTVGAVLREHRAHRAA